MSLLIFLVESFVSLWNFLISLNVSLILMKYSFDTIISVIKCKPISYAVQNEARWGPNFQNKSETRSISWSTLYMEESYWAAKCNSPKKLRRGEHLLTTPVLYNWRNNDVLVHPESQVYRTHSPFDWRTDNTRRNRGRKELFRKESLFVEMT